MKSWDPEAYKSRRRAHFLVLEFWIKAEALQKSWMSSGNVSSGHSRLSMTRGNEAISLVHWTKTHVYPFKTLSKILISLFSLSITHLSCSMEQNLGSFHLYLNQHFNLWCILPFGYLLRYKLNIGRIGCASCEPDRCVNQCATRGQIGAETGRPLNRYSAREYIWELV